jgi:hypothetical protein
VYPFSQKLVCGFIGSDGFWDMISPKEALENILLPSGKLMVSLFFYIFIFIKIVFLHKLNF